MAFVYIDKEGNELFGKEFDWAGSFHGGLACVKDFSGRFSFIDKTGSAAIYLPQTQQQQTQFFSGRALVQKGALSGFVDMKGEVVIDYLYRDALHFSEGYAPVAVSGGWTLIDVNGKSVLSKPFRRIGRFANDRALCQLLAGDGQFAFLDTKLKTILGPFDHAKEFHEGMARVHLGDDECFIDINGNVLFSVGWSYVSDYCFCGRVAYSDGDKYGYLNEFGNVVIAAKYSEASNFSDDIAVVSERDGEHVGIGLDGEILFRLEAESVGGFRCGAASFTTAGGLGFIDKHGRIFVQPQYEATGFFSDGLCPVAKKLTIEH